MQVRKATLIGGGVIGAGWAARLIENGIDVTLCDPDPEVERKVGEVLANADRAYAKLTMAPRGRRGSVSFVRDVEAAVEGADFVQESAPEREDLKIPLFARIDRATRPDVIIASSTSGLLPSRLQSAMAHPERFTVGHPFNPVYLLPLVEICGGERTSVETKERAAAFYEGIGMRALHVRKEIDGFIADRLMEAMWRESLHLIDEDVATAEELDDAIRFGAGLRWSFMGNYLVYRIAGGEQGMRHFMAQFGPALKLPWTKLEAPELTDGLLDKVVAQSDQQAGDRSIRELERLRDDCLISVMQGLQAHDWGAGQVLKSYAAKLYDASYSRLDIDAIDLAKPLDLYRTRIPADWVDYNGHMNESRYLQLFSDGSEALLRLIGLDQGYLARGFSWFTVETHIMHKGETHAGELVGVTTQVLAADEKRMHIFQTATREEDGTVVATGEQMLLHVDTKAGRACPAEPAMRDRLLRIAAAQVGVPRPADVGRHVGERRLPRSPEHAARGEKEVLHPPYVHDIRQLTIDLVTFGAMHVSAFAAQSKLNLDSLPEHFIESTVAQSISSKHRVILQRSVRDILRNANVQFADDDPNVADLLEKIMDMVIYRKSDELETRPIMLVEYKKWVMDLDDRVKLIRALQMLGESVFGARIVLFNDTKKNEWIVKCHAKADEIQETWEAIDIDNVTHKGRGCCVYGHVVNFNSRADDTELRLGSREIVLG